MTSGDHEDEDNAAGTGDRFARMEWTQEGKGIATLVVHDYHCKVWPVHRLGGWAAMVSQGGIATASYDFTTQTDAQVWCERQLPRPANDDRHARRHG